MSYLQEKLDIEEYFRAGWTHTPIVYENGESLEEGDWVRLTIANGRAFQASMGDNPAFRFYGIVYLQIYTQTDVGSGRALELVDYADAMFRNLVLTNLRFKVPQVKRIPNNQRVNLRPEWMQINVSTEFYRGT